MIGRIDGTNIYLSEDQLPAFTLSLNDLTDPSKIRGARSTTIRAINTKEFRRVVGSQYMHEGPRDTRPTLTIGEGSADVYRAEVIAVRTDRNEGELIAAGGNAGWFDVAKRTKLREYDFGESGVLFLENMQATWTDEDSLLYFPLIDFGSFEGRSSSYNVQPELLRPAFRIHRVIEEVLGPLGFTMVPRGTLAKRWKKLGFIQPSDKVLTADPMNNPTGAAGSVSGSTGITLTDLGTTPVVYPLGAEVYDPDNRFNIASMRYTMGNEGTIDVRISMLGLGLDPFSPPIGEIFTATLYDYTAGAVLATYSQTHQAGGELWFNHTWSDIAVPNGNLIGVGIQIDPSSTFTGPINNLPEARVIFSPHNPLYTPQFYPYEVAYGSRPITINTAMPSMSLMDLITAVSNDQCLVFDTVGQTGVINVWFDHEFFRTPAPGVTCRDWSTRMDHTTPPAKVIDDNPSRILLRFKEDTGDETMVVLRDGTPYPEYANADLTLPMGYGQEQEITIPFAPSAMEECFGGPVIPVMRQVDRVYQADSYGRVARLLVFDGVATGNWTCGSTGLTEYPRSYFVTDDERGYPLHFDNATAGYLGTAPAQWNSRLRRMRDSRILEASLLVRDHELQDFDHGMPTLVDDGSGPAWYYVQEIKGHRFGAGVPTKCVLVEIPGALVDAASVTPSNAAIEYPELIVNPAFVPPCTNAPRFPTPPVLVSYRVSASSQAAVEADPTSYPVGMRFAIACLSGGGSANWDAWVGDVVQRVAPGAGTDGSAWQRLNLPPGSIVENADFASATQWDRYLITSPGFMTFYGFRLMSMDPSGNWIFDDLYDPCGAIVANSSYIWTVFADACRCFQIQANTTTDQSTGWVDVGDDLFMIYGSGTVPLPPGALYARVKYMRGPHLQGYSDRTLIV